MWNVTVCTLFPEMFPGPLGQSLAGKALQENIWSLNTVDIRNFATDKHATVDDRPFGGGAGMVMRPDVLGDALDSLLTNTPSPPKLLYMSPRGSLFTQEKSQELLAQEHIAILCGRYEGIDQRILDHYPIEEISIGDYILSGGEIAAITVIDTCVRQLSGVIGNDSAVVEESFGHGAFSGLLEYPQYTRPAEWRNHKVPQALLSGNHAEIEAWRKAQAEEITKNRREDMWQRYQQRHKK